MSETQAANTASTAFRDWEDVVDQPENQTPPPSGDKESLFLKLKARPDAYRFRFVARPFTFRKHWNAFRSLRNDDGKSVGSVISPAPGVAEMKLDAAWSEGGYKPDQKYAGLVINRENGRFAIVESGTGVFKTILDYQRETKISIYGDQAPDWSVKVKKTKGLKGEKTEYVVLNLPGSPLTEEEKQQLANFSTKLDWHKFFIAATPEEITALYARLAPELKKNPQARTPQGAAPAAKPAVAAPAAAKPTPTPQAAAPAAAAAAPVKTAEKAPTPVAEDPNDTSWADGDAQDGEQAQF